MKQDIKNKELQERQSYVPASVEVIEITEQEVMCIMCTSPIPNGFDPYNDGFDI